MRKFLALVVMVVWVGACSSERSGDLDLDVGMNQGTEDADDWDVDEEPDVADLEPDIGESDTAEPDATEPEDPDATEFDVGGPGHSCEFNEDCDEDDYCDRPFGCEVLGTCEPLPSDVVCGDAMTPYCNCHGERQESPDSCIWEPQQAMEACEESPAVCESNDDCVEDDEYCQREPGCGEEGECRPLEELYAPGCDDFPTTYCTCEGVTRVAPDSCIPEPYDHLGECDTEVTPGECETNDDCGPNQYCDREPGCEEPGQCAQIPWEEACLPTLTEYCDCTGESQMATSSCIYDAYDYLGECLLSE
jgi:hypothetical protein